MLDYECTITLINFQIEEILQIKNIFHSNVKVVSNYLEYDAEGRVAGLSGEIIHVYNKNESAIQVTT